MTAEKKQEFRDKFGDLYHQLNMEQWIDDLVDEACKKAKIEELSNFLVIVSGATDILDRMQTIEVLHNRIKELSPKEKL